MTSFISEEQQTVASPVAWSGVGVHSNRLCHVRLEPAEANAGIVFEVARTEGGAEAGRIPATLESAAPESSLRQTILGDPEGLHVATPEHLLSALRALGIDNAIIRIDAPELPQLDGGSAQFAEGIIAAGSRRQGEPRRALSVSRPVCWSDGPAHITAHPFEGFAISYFADYNEQVVGKQSASFEITPESYVREIAPARTTAFEREIEAIKRQGLGLGGSLETVVVIGQDGYLNKKLHFPDEVVRHKVLDLIGDLALLGMPVRGHILAEKTGHRDNVRFAKVLKENFL